MLGISRSSTLAVVVALLGAALPWTAYGRPPGVAATDAELGYSTSRIVVRFTPRALRRSRRSGKVGRSLGAKSVVGGIARGVPGGVSDAVAATASAWGVARIRSLCHQAPANAQAASACGLSRTFVLDVPPGTDTLAMVAAFTTLGDVELADVDPIGTVAELIPNDPEFINQYGMHNTGQCIQGFNEQCDGGRFGKPDADIDAPEAWMLHTGDLGTTTIAIVDTGVHPHPEFAGRLLAGTNTVTGDDPNDTSDSLPHGTFVAGVAAAAGNNGMGVAGVNWGVNILPVRVFNGRTGGLSDTAAGIVWAVDNDADVINISLQFCFDGTFVHPLKDAVDYAAANGVLVVAAAGNDDNCGRGTVAFPAKYANTIAVGATNLLDLKAGFSNFGNELELAAPGESIRSTWVQSVCEGGTNDGSICVSNFTCFGGGTCTRLESTFRWDSGTSFASPAVAGLATLVKSFVPTLSAAEIRSILTSSADDLGTAGRDRNFGFGRINAHHALLQSIGVPWILSTDPVSGALDARQPSEPDGTDEAGWQIVDVMFGGDASTVVKEDFEVTDDSGAISAPSVLVVLPPTPSNASWRLVLSRKIAVAARTTIRHIGSDGTVQLRSLPGDVNADALADTVDLLVLHDVLVGAVAAPPMYASDIDRTGLTTPADLLREVDLLNGAGVYATLPTSLP